MKEKWGARERHTIDVSCPRCSLFTFGIQNTKITRKMRMKNLTLNAFIFGAETGIRSCRRDFLICPSHPSRFTGEWSCCSSCKQENHCMRLQRGMLRVYTFVRETIYLSSSRRFNSGG